MGFIQEFKDFAVKGNVLDLSVAVVLGGAFGAIVTAAVDNILMPIVGMLTGGVDFKSLVIKVGSAELKYGMFIQATITFIIIALFLFMVVKAANRMAAKTPPPPPAPAEPTLTEKLLMEIRDNLKK
jgi:large conductance mechanosensitive channel